jgi:hypothetical protein
VTLPAGATADSLTFRLAAGTWDWMHGDTTCTTNPHTVSFSRDGRFMVLTFARADSATGQREYRYRILEAGKEVIPDVPHVIRAAMEGETRRTPDGKLVVWDLILASRNRYHWHRTDWPEMAVTNAIVRCSGTRPLETWAPPSGARSSSRAEPDANGRAARKG